MRKIVVSGCSNCPYIVFQKEYIVGILIVIVLSILFPLAYAVQWISNILLTTAIKLCEYFPFTND